MTSVARRAETVVATDGDRSDVEVVEDDDPVDADPPRGSRPLTRFGRGVLAHPLLTVAVVASVVALGHAVWIWTHRHLGAFDPDEAGYAAHALRVHRTIDLQHPFAAIREAVNAGNGPFVPSLAVPLLLPGPRDPRTVMMIQPILLVLGSVSVAGIARRLSGSGAALACGLTFLVLPTVGLATQSFWLGLGAASMMGVSVWALLASERGANRWVWVYGAAMAAMTLSRTMALAFVPGLVVAGVIMTWGDRRGQRRIVGSWLLAAAIAGPWFLVMRETVFGYLVSYGYGPRAGLFGQGGPLQRLEFRYERISGDVGRGLTTSAVLVALVGAAVIGWRWWRSRTPPDGGRPTAAVLATFVLGLAALVSTTNNGVWFELPLIVLLVPLVGSLAARAMPVFRAALSLQIAAQAVVVLAVLWWIVPPRWGITAHYENGFAQYDERFASDRRDELSAAARDWRRVNAAVAEEMRRLDGQDGLGAVFVVTGNMQLLNTNTIALASELSGWGPRQEVPDTTAETARLAEHLTPTATGADGRIVERVLVVALHDQHLFTPDAEVIAFYRRARAEGWRVATTIAMPDGGEVAIMRHVSS